MMMKPTTLVVHAGFSLDLAQKLVALLTSRGWLWPYLRKNITISSILLEGRYGEYCLQNSSSMYPPAPLLYPTT